MSIRTQALEEMKRANFDQGDIEAMDNILAIFFDTWDSGGAVWAMEPVLSKLIRGEPLGPLTGEDDEWFDHGPAGACERVWQNKRCSSVFINQFSRNDFRFNDVDSVKEQPIYPSREELIKGCFPYIPGKRNLDPVVTI